MPIPVSVLDLAPAAPGQSAGSSIADSLAVARQAEESGFQRVWYAEHHNMPTIMSSATSVLIAHIAAHTSRIRVGAGGIMLPNHSPLVIAEQFGTLEAMHPGRIDLGLGRASGSDPNTARALRRRSVKADEFPLDVLELQALLEEGTTASGVRAYPGTGSNVPLYILGSSLYGAQLAATYGLPYVFASHFAPALLTQAVDLYRAEFQPSAHLAAPYVIAGVNVVAADTDDEADAIFTDVLRKMARSFQVGGPNTSDEQLDHLIVAGAARQVEELFRHTAVVDAATVATYLRRFVETVEVDELITVHQAPQVQARLRSLTVTAQAMSLPSEPSLPASSALSPLTA
ncbi:luciferase family oxidoreductase group 1 [Kineococcus radiotolerans]|uniref:Luciferase family oxidoreductase group 1 n=1 Tax=Kineococcus radiotolerans TaxID=131568 RepID=A0A7W4XZB8_KINRA|nr:LLM class flavin-dependent oxidoreductase [Kineococcus radiotolerans]MBB2903407.1 luciferase family oxidoreductase group 1 [Kineococcus radiotolerans]